MKENKVKGAGLLEWRQYSSDEYRSVARQLIHFSHKTINSKSASGGVRLAPNIISDVPYLSCANIDAATIPTEFAGTSGMAAIARQIGAAVDGSVITEYGVPDDNQLAALALVKKEKRKAVFAAFESASPVSLDEIAMIVAIYNETLEGSNATLGMPDHMQKRLMLPDGSGGDVVFIPVHSGGFASIVSTAISRYLDKAAEKLSVKKYSLAPVTIDMPYGGSNPQNVGQHIRSLQSPILCQCPVEDMESKQIFAMHYKGIPVIQFAPAFKFAQDAPADIRQNMIRRQKSEDWVASVVRSALHRGEQAYELLDANRDILGLEEKDVVVAKSCPLPAAGLIEPAMRNARWREMLADAVFTRLCNLDCGSYTINGKKVSVVSPFGIDDRSWVRRTVIKEAL